jgi:hypothetical protein
MESLETITRNEDECMGSRGAALQTECAPDR